MARDDDFISSWWQESHLCAYHHHHLYFFIFILRLFNHVDSFEDNKDGKSLYAMIGVAENLIEFFRSKRKIYIQCIFTPEKLNDLKLDFVNKI